MESWRGVLREDLSGDESKAFVHQRLEQVPQAMTEETLDQQVALTLKALLRGEVEPIEAQIARGHFPPKPPVQMAVQIAEGSSDGSTNVQAPTSEATDASGGISESSILFVGEEAANPPQPLPYWFLPTDWARLAEAYQVDFILHGLPGTEGCQCSHCGCSGHVHVGPRAPGIDLCLHVGWRGAGRRKGRKGASDDNDRKLQETWDRGDAWGHWEPLGAGPIKAPLPRQQSTLESHLDLNHALKEDEQANLNYQPSDEYSWALGLAGFNCVHITSCTCEKAVCLQPDKCQTGSPCPKKIKDCCDTDRRVSDDNIADLGNSSEGKEPDAEGKEPDAEGGKVTSAASIVTEVCEAGMVAATASSNTPSGSSSSSTAAFQQPTLSPRGRSRGGSGSTGARFSVMLEGRELFEGVDLEDNSPLRQADAAAGGSAGVANLERFRKAFIEAVSVAAGIAPSRVRILDIGLPFETSMKIQAQRLANITPVKESPSASARSASPPREPDTGAGVLRFLTDEGEAPTADSAFSPAPPPDAALSPTSPATALALGSTTAGCSSPPVTPPRVAPTPWQTPVDVDPLTPPPVRRGARDAEARTGTVVRVLAVLREPLKSIQAAEREEPDAMMALELVVTELADPMSFLQCALKNSTDDRAKLIWCPEAEGPHKGRHRGSAAARARHQLAAAKNGTVALRGAC